MACKTRRDKSALLRLVRRPDGSVVVDASGSLEGRGAYICSDGACLRTALQRSAFERALRTKLSTQLRTRLEQGDIAAIRVVPANGAPAAIQGGSHGT